MVHPFQLRLDRFVGAPARREFTPPGQEQRFVWTEQQQTAGRRRHQPRRWVYVNSARTAYHVSMHLLMRRMPPPR